MGKRFLSVCLLCLLVCLLVAENGYQGIAAGQNEDSDFIRWVDFDVTYEALCDTMDLDIETYEQDLQIGWVESLAYLGTMYGGNFTLYKKADLQAMVDKLQAGSSMDDLIAGYQYYAYYHEAYGAVLGGLLGLQADGAYGLTAYSPVGAGYWYTDSDDFGNGRSYGFARKHLGHDLFCSVGTPIMAVEDGVVEALGWNQYGGWRIGIRSGDGLRYYYYAHLRKDNPYAKGLSVGDKVKAGQLIGYSGQTGYSIKKNVNNIQVPHLHFGLQLVFDESQKECNSEIWIDVYALVRLLSKHRASVDASAMAVAEVAPTGVSDGDPSENKGSVTESTTAGASNAETTEDSVQVPILMYHGLTTKESQINDYFIPVEVFKSDLAYLRQHDYTAVTMTELIDFVYDKTGTVTLPSKPVVLTFDDGYYNNYKYASPLLSEYGMKAVLSVIGDACERESSVEYQTEDYGEVTWNQIRELSESGLWEIQNHTWNLHENNGGRKGASQMEGEDFSSYQAMLITDLSLLQNRLEVVTGVQPNTFTWPYGAQSETGSDGTSVRGLLKKLGFQASLSCRSGVNTVTRGDTEGLFLLKRNLRKPGIGIEELLSSSIE